ncbi:O-antigen ligase family protein [Aliivibrio fischeri]|uniref:O-antigen ligase family protein n=2 Tax=Aliivibrio fischeri TaxID=668 RepID=UPI000B16B868|nr:O-antigen ligase family protein [Aliivibrio fischeri]
MLERVRGIICYSMYKMSNIKSKITHLIEHKMFEKFMFINILGYALFKISYRPLGDIFQSFIVLGFLLFLFCNFKKAIKDKAFICLFLSILLTCLSWINSTFQIPHLAKDSPNIGILADLFFFIFIAYWLKGNIKKVRTLWLFYAIGVFLTALIHSNDILADIMNGIAGQRIDFNYVNANHLSALAGTILLGSSYYIYALNGIKNKILITLFILLPSLFITIVSQGRQVWLAVLIASILTPIIVAIISKKVNIKSISIILAVVISSIYLASHIPTIEKRIHKESNIVPLILSGDVDNIPYSSMGIRMHFWSESIPWIKNNPLLGTGEGTRNFVIKESNNLPNKIKSKYTHLHNGHIELIISYGLLGVALFLYIYTLIMYSSTFYKKNNEVLIISTMFILFFAIINCFESFLFFKTGEYMINIIFGGIYTFYLTHNLSMKDNNE